MAYRSGGKEKYFVRVHTIKIEEFSVYADRISDARQLVHNTPFPELRGGRECTKITISDEYNTGAETEYIGDFTLFPEEEIRVLRDVSAAGQSSGGD